MVRHLLDLYARVAELVVSRTIIHAHCMPWLKSVAARRMVFDSWEGSLENLKAIRCAW